MNGNRIITVGDLPPLGRLSLKPGVVCHRVWQYYCKPMQARGRCSPSCGACHGNVASIFSRVGAKGDRLRDEAAVLVWACREMVADIEEQSELPRAQVETDSLGEPTNRSIFEQLLETLK